MNRSALLHLNVGTHKCPTEAAVNALWLDLLTKGFKWRFSDLFPKSFKSGLYRAKSWRLIIMLICFLLFIPNNLHHYVLDCTGWRDIMWFHDSFCIQHVYSDARWSEKCTDQKNQQVLSWLPLTAGSAVTARVQTSDSTWVTDSVDILWINILFSLVQTQCYFCLGPWGLCRLNHKCNAETPGQHQRFLFLNCLSDGCC